MAKQGTSFASHSQNGHASHKIYKVLINLEDEEEENIFTRSDSLSSRMTRDTEDVRKSVSRLTRFFVCIKPDRKENRNLEVKDRDKMIFIIFVLISLVNVGFGEPQLTDNGFDESFPEENPGLFEGDIELTGVNPFNRNAIGNKNRLWPNRVVPYMISHRFSERTRHTILSAMQEIQTKTQNCIRFVPKQNYHHYSLTYRTGRGCHSPIGFTGTYQYATLGNGCLIKGIVIHETLHSLGFFHEQSRPDRDQYIKVIRSNILPGKEGNFRILFPPVIDNQNFPYDYHSIMHYGRYSFAKDRHKPTIIPLNRNAKIGQRYGLSPTDIKEIRKLYGCN